jgi:hypothetical protein
MLSLQLITTLHKLLPDLQAEMLNYAEYLATKSTQPQSSDPTQKIPPSRNGERHVPNG